MTFLRRNKTMPAIGLHHVGIYTIDMDRSKRFYEDMLGFTASWTGEVPLPAGIFKVTMVTAGTCTVELVQPPNPSMVSAAHGPVQHLALQVTKLMDLIAQLRGKGVVFETDVETTVRVFPPHGIVRIFIKGPSGERIELVENLPVPSF